MVISRKQNTGKGHNWKTDNCPFERVGQFKYLGAYLKKQNCIHEEIKSTLKSGSDCHHQVQNPLTSSLLSKNIKFKIYTTKILSVCFVCV